jgi:hypothetical protein
MYHWQLVFLPWERDTWCNISYNGIRNIFERWRCDFWAIHRRDTIKYDHQLFIIWYWSSFSCYVLKLRCCTSHPCFCHPTNIVFEIYIYIMIWNIYIYAQLSTLAMVWCPSKVTINTSYFHPAHQCTILGVQKFFGHS